MGRRILFALLASLFACQAGFAENAARQAAARLPRYEDLVFVEGRLTQVTLSPCRYTYIVHSRRGGPSTICIDIFDLALDTRRGARTIEAPDYELPYRLSEIAEWQAQIGRPVRAGTGTPCPRPPTPCLFELAVGDDHAVRHERILKQTHGAGIAAAFFIGAFGTIMLLVVATMPMPKTPPPADA